MKEEETATAAVLTEKVVQLVDAVKRRATRKDILEAEDVTYENVEVPEWKCTVRLKSLTAGDAMAFAKEAKKKDESTAALKMVVMSVVDDQDNRLFTDDDIPALQKKSMKAVVTIQKVAMKMNGLDSVKDEQEAAKND